MASHDCFPEEGQKTAWRSGRFYYCAISSKQERTAAILFVCRHDGKSEPRRFRFRISFLPVPSLPHPPVTSPSLLESSPLELLISAALITVGTE